MIFQSKKQALNKLDEYYVDMIDKGFHFQQPFLGILIGLL